MYLAPHVKESGPKDLSAARDAGTDSGASGHS
jgi:hypothetical protein